MAEVRASSLIDRWMLESSHGGLLTDRLGYAASLWVGAGVTAAGALVALLFLPETRSGRPEPATGRRRGLDAAFQRSV